ncbi:MAG: hypothetical protein E7047_09640 [Lentisphaerae bacterium]|nr:hypothetical protein [Lentisphaerota bacterium]
MENNTVTTKTVKTKTNAPWILGIVGFACSIPHALCFLICAAAVSTAEFMATDGDTAAAQSTADAGAAMFYLGLLVSLVCFIALFFGKKDGQLPVIAGVITILGAAFLLICSVMSFSLFGLASAVCYAIGGIFCIVNSKRPAC